MVQSANVSKKLIGGKLSTMTCSLLDCGGVGKEIEFTLYMYVATHAFSYGQIHKYTWLLSLMSSLYRALFRYKGNGFCC